jgi:hypothetical protein
MTIVTSYDWESDSWTQRNGDHPARTAWRAAVEEIATKARAKLPECASRVTKAVTLVLNNDVELLADGTARVASQSHGNRSYYIVHGHCDCTDFAQAPHSLCKHRLSAAIARRAQELVQAKLDAPANSQATSTQLQAVPATPTPSLPEAPASVNCHILLAGRQVQITLRDTDESRLLARLAALLRQYPPAQPPPQAAAQTPVCQWHGAMKESTKAKGTWYCPAKMADGSYCTSRYPEKHK